MNPTDIKLNAAITQFESAALKEHQRFFLDIILKWSKDFGEGVINLRGDVHLSVESSDEEIRDISFSILSLIFHTPDQKLVIEIIRGIIQDTLAELETPNLHDIVIELNSYEENPGDGYWKNEKSASEIKLYKKILDEICRTLYPSENITL